MTGADAVSPSPKKSIDLSEHTSFTPKFYSIAVLVGTIVVVGVWLIVRFAAADLNRDLYTWQDKLNLIAESRANEVDTWIANRFKSMRSLASNPSLQIYLGELQSNGKSASAVEPAQKTYLRNLLLFTAEQTGFTTTENAPINANVPQDNMSGLAIIGSDGQIIASTTMSPGTAAFLNTQAKKQPTGKESLIDMQKDSDGTLYLGFVAPVFSIQDDRNSRLPIGQIVGITAVDESLFHVLKHPGTTEKSLETILVRTSGTKIDFLSPLLDGAAPLAKQIDVNTPHSAESELLRTVGDFSSTMKDYRDRTVLATSRAVTGAPWKLIVKIDRDEALADSNEHRNDMILVFFLLVGVVALTVATVWWHAHSKRALTMSRYFRKLAAQTLAQEHLLRLVTDHQPEPIYIVDTQSHYYFANHKASLESGMAPEFILGKTLSDVRGTGRALYVSEHCDKALKSRRIIYDMARVHTDHGEKVIRTAFVPLDHIPVVNLPESTAGVLVIEQDISEIIYERERRLEIQNQLIQTLIKMVDRRDPFSANHSLLVSQVAHKIASDMELHAPLIETAHIAGCLMNIGKIVVPTELLTKTKSLTADEKRIIQESMLAAAELVKGINFDGPVAETLRQWQEKWDGSGPLGLRGEAILVTARIIAIANAFIGMISPRSWRTAIPIESATNFLLDQSDTHFDRRIVVALINFIENHNGRAWVENILQDKKTAA